MTDRLVTASVTSAMNQGTKTSTGEHTAPRGGWAGMDAGMDRGMRVLSYLLSGVIVYGLLGWLGDHLLHTVFLLPLGIVLGAALGVFVIIRRYGSETGSAAATPPVRRRFVKPSQEYVIRRIPR